MNANLKNPVTNQVKQVKAGFSWTTFFWGFFPALFRGDWKWFVIIFLIDIITGSFTYGFGSGVVGIIFAFFYNKLYITDLMNNGFVPADDASKNILLSKGISIINVDTNESTDSTNEISNVYVQNKPLYKRVWFIILAVFIALIAIGVIIGAVTDSDSDTASNNSSQNADSSISNDSKSSSESESDSSVPTEYKSALNKSKSYSSMMNMSKAGIYDQLTADAGEQFSAEAAQYAIDNLNADYNKNALKKAKSYQDDMSMSPDAIQEQLTSDAGEKFTPEEASYAVQHLND